ncbi:hypothetical protein EI555_021074, partial [Monodon monoceros]
AKNDEMELPKALSDQWTCLSAFLNMLSRSLSTASLLSNYWFVGIQKVPKPLCGKGLPAKCFDVPVPLDGSSTNVSSLEVVQYSWETGDDRFTCHAFGSGMWLSYEEIVEDPGERCRSLLELTPPTKRGEKGLLEFATLQDPCHPSLRFGGKRLMEKAFIPHLPLGLGAKILRLSLGVRFAYLGLELIGFLLLLMDLLFTGNRGREHLQSWRGGPSGDGGPYDVVTSLPSNGRLGSRTLEAPCLELWLGLLTRLVLEFKCKHSKSFRGAPELPTASPPMFPPGPGVHSPPEGPLTSHPQYHHQTVRSVSGGVDFSSELHTRNFNTGPAGSLRKRRPGHL